VNKWFKDRVLLVLVWGLHRLVGKHVITKDKIPDEGQNEFIRLWCDVFEEGLVVWCGEYRGIDTTSSAFSGDSSNDALRKMNDLLVTLCMSDGAYHNLFDQMMMVLLVRFGERYPGKIRKIMYNAKGIDDIDYYAITGKNEEHMVLQLGENTLVVKKGDAVLVKGLKVTRD
jgi:hypothetical protein